LKCKRFSKNKKLFAVAPLLLGLSPGPHPPPQPKSDHSIPAAVGNVGNTNQADPRAASSRAAGRPGGRRFVGNVGYLFLIANIANACASAGARPKSTN